jgi:hypothetical protein
LNKQVDPSIVDSEFIARVRKKLALDQRDAVQIFGGGVNAFSRCESGKAKPSAGEVAQSARPSPRSAQRGENLTKRADRTKKEYLLNELFN